MTEASPRRLLTIVNHLSFYQPELLPKADGAIDAPPPLLANLFSDRCSAIDGCDLELAVLANRGELARDLKRELSQSLGILDRDEGVCLRATFIVDPQGVIRFASVNDLSVGRNPEEVLRVLDALQTEGLCACNWQRGEATLDAA